MAISLFDTQRFAAKRRTGQSSARAFALVALSLLAAACNTAPRIDTVDDLATALKDHGIAFDTTEPIDFSNLRFARIDEGVTLTGENLHVELLRIEDERTFNLASGASAFLAFLADNAGENFPRPPEVIARQPFVAIVRNEPEPGAIKRVLDELLPVPSTY